MGITFYLLLVSLQLSEIHCCKCITVVITVNSLTNVIAIKQSALLQNFIPVHSQNRHYYKSVYHQNDIKTDISRLKLL